jgi:hypothetical protein
MDLFPMPVPMSVVDVACPECGVQPSEVCKGRTLFHTARKEFWHDMVTVIQKWNRWHDGLARPIT